MHSVNKKTFFFFLLLEKEVVLTQLLVQQIAKQLPFTGHEVFTLHTELPLKVTP